MEYLTAELPGTGGAIKVALEDFIVEEIPAYLPSGEGQHVFLLVEKRGLTTQEMVRRLAQVLGVASEDVGTAGQKDRQAVARQFVSVPGQGLDLDRLAALQLDGVTILSTARHPHKLRTGHLRGNRFTLVVRGVGEGAEARARAILAMLEAVGVPNRYGAQRFGMRGDNAAQGRAVLTGKLRVPDRFRRRLLVSALQADLFNRYLSRRMVDRLLDRVLDGDILQRSPTGGLFTCPADEVEVAQRRLAAREIVPTGPIFGHAMMAPPPGTTAHEREREILAEAGLEASDFGRLGRLAEGTRRPLVARLDGVEVRADGDRLCVGFALPAGSYATVVLEEIMKPGAPLAVAEEA
ncbi:MAG TPA: tRNA pseudouridine(13) synthase TruD [Polyangia bacterium]|nr:tRNA pseudouridine(13) synthase TruD [Polyangia bacterium]